MKDQPKIDLLLVEDSPDHLELASRVLRQMNIPLNIHVSQDGEDALNFVFARGAYQNQEVASVKLILLDLYLPKVGGIDVLQRLRSDPRTKSIPVAILTITGNEQSLLEQPPYNVKHYLRKPLELNDFLKLYETYIKDK